MNLFQSIDRAYQTLMNFVDNQWLISEEPLIQWKESAVHSLNDVIIENWFKGMYIA